MTGQEISDALKQIGAALQKRPSAAEAYQLVLRCDPLRQAARARLEAVTQRRNGSAIPDPPAVTQAMRRGVEGVLELQRERELLEAALKALDSVEAQCLAAQRDARRAELAAAIPKEVRRVPELVSHLRETMANFDAAVAALQQALNIIGEFENVGLDYPFNDQQLAELLELRNRVWLPRVINPPHDVPMALEDEPGAIGERVRKFARSWSLIYVRPAGALGSVLATRKPPRVEHVPEFDGSEHRSPRLRRSMDGLR